MNPSEPIPAPPAAKLQRLREIIRACSSLLVAYSGGVDSALVALIAHQELGERSQACLGVSPSLPRREMRHAVKLAEQMGVVCRLVNTLEGDDARYAANGADRCFFCKSELFGRLIALARDEGWSAVADGVHAEDISDHHNGIAAARRLGVRSPLLEAGLVKQDVRDLARHLGLAAWDKPATACLASRVPTGVAITPELLGQIDAAEDVLFDLGFTQFRVRHHGQLARVELSAQDLSRAIELREAIVAGVRAAGYRFVALDLEPFRSGSLATQPARQLVTLPIRGHKQ
ncbi:MAG TPA: ATP-dependent sacrificial sulfur transferase LarE [Tepidisphaeraceae bacterium]|nr:ATP-dependent sacrificial sulfur transferase LarE [Tepidisphaeraceae bacterium]